MDNWQQDTTWRWNAFLQNKGKSGFAVCMKLRVSGCFCREHHAPAANRLIDDYRQRHPLDPKQCEYVEHESGPELLLYLGLGAAGLGLARESLSLLKSAIDLATAIVKARSEGVRRGDRQGGSLVILISGFDFEGASLEKQAIEAKIQSPPTKKTIQQSIDDVIQLLAEEKSRHAITKPDKSAADSKKRKRATRKPNE